MAKHRHRKIRWWRLRGAYADLHRDFARLATEHRSLRDDHEALLADMSEAAVQSPEPRPEQTAWGLENELAAAEDDTSEIPIITSLDLENQEGMDPDKAEALIRRTGLLDDVSGSWRVVRPQSG